MCVRKENVLLHTHTHTHTHTQGIKSRGRLRARSKYVDVLNPEGSSKSQSDSLPPPGPLGAPLMSGGQFSGSFFTPQLPVAGLCILSLYYYL